MRLSSARPRQPELACAEGSKENTKIERGIKQQAVEQAILNFSICCILRLLNIEGKERNFVSDQD